MFHYMWAQTDDLTWMVMAKYVENNMRHQQRNGHRFSTTSSGWSDTSIKSNYIFSRQETEFGENEYGRNGLANHVIKTRQGSLCTVGLTELWQLPQGVARNSNARF